jgi:hypothetical protein
MSEQSQPKTGSEAERNDPLSRRRFLEKSVRGATLAGAIVLPGWGVTGAFSESAYARGRRVSKATAHYQYRPNKGQHCGICAHFRPPEGCEIVSGRIVPNGWCRYFRHARARRGGGGGGAPGGGGYGGGSPGRGGY